MCNNDLNVGSLNSWIFSYVICNEYREKWNFGKVHALSYVSYYKDIVVKYLLQRSTITHIL